MLSGLAAHSVLVVNFRIVAAAHRESREHDLATQ